MTVTEQPAVVSSLLADILKEVRQRVSRKVQALHDAAGRTVGDDVVHRPTMRLQVPPGLGILLLRRQLLRPPGLAHDPILPPALPEQTEEFFTIVRYGRVQDAVLNVMGGGPAHGEEGVPFQCEDLSPHGLTYQLTSHLAKVCGPCEHCKDGCPYTDEDTRIQLPGDVMEQAGFSRGVRLDMRIGDHEVILSEAESYDLRDVPPEVRKTLQQLGICLDELDGLLAGGGVIYEG